jgi:hypothetical protein
MKAPKAPRCRSTFHNICTRTFTKSSNNVTHIRNRFVLVSFWRAADPIWTSIPVLRFRTEPGKLFASGVIAWTLLAFTYFVMIMRFLLRGSRTGIFQFFWLARQMRDSQSI